MTQPPERPDERGQKAPHSNSWLRQHGLPPRLEPIDEISDQQTRRLPSIRKAIGGFTGQLKKVSRDAERLLRELTSERRRMWGREHSGERDPHDIEPPQS